MKVVIEFESSYDPILLFIVIRSVLTLSYNAISLILKKISKEKEINILKISKSHK